MNNPNIVMIIAAVGLGLSMFAPKLWEMLKPYWPKKAPTKGSSSRKGKEAEVEEDTETDSLVRLQYLEFYSIHDIVQYLIEDRKAAKDKEGILLAGSFGSHIYNKMLEGVK